MFEKRGDLTIVEWTRVVFLAPGLLLLTFDV